MHLKQLFTSALICGLFSLSSLQLAANSAVKAPLAWILPDKVSLSLTASPPLANRKLASLTLTPEGASPWVPVAFDALMPEHKHGMNVEPSVPTLKGQAYEIRGVKLHMPGAWLLRLRVKHQQTGEERWLERPLLIPF